MSDRPAKPEYMGWLSPMIVVKDVAKAMKFYAEIFGFKKGLELSDKNGKLIHGEMTFHDVFLMFFLENPERNEVTPATLGGTPVQFYLYTENVDEFYASVKKTDAKELQGLTDQYWGDRTCHFMCPEGHVWMFAQNMADVDVSNMTL